jgi:hypothetical protein
MVRREGRLHGGDGPAVKASSDLNHPGAVSAQPEPTIEGRLRPFLGSKPPMRGGCATTTII